MRGKAIKRELLGVLGGAQHDPVVEGGFAHGGAPLSGYGEGDSG